MSFVFNTNLPRNGINWRLFSFENTSQYQTAINQNVGKTFIPTASLVSSPFSNTSAVNSVALSNGDLLCSGSEGLYTFNPVTLQFTYKSNNTFLDKMCLLDDGNVLCIQGFNGPIIINPNNGSYVRSGDLIIIASKTTYNGSLEINQSPQTFTLILSDSALKYTTGIIVNVQDNNGSNSFIGTITATTSNSITIQKTSQTGIATSDYWDITVVGQTASALNTFKSSILNFQKIPISTNKTHYVLTDSSMNRGVYIDALNWTISFEAISNQLFKSSSKYSADTINSSIRFPETTYTKIISTRLTNAYAMSDDSNNLKLVYPGGNITNSSTIDSPNVFCLLPQIDFQYNNQAQGRILLWVTGGQYQVWNTINNEIQTLLVSGSAPDTYTQPVQLLDGRIFLKPFPNNSNPSSFLIFGGGGGFNPNVTLSPYFNKWN